MISRRRADKCVLQTQFVTLHGEHYRFTLGAWWPEGERNTKFYLEIAEASIDGHDQLLDILYHADFNGLINRAEDCYLAELERPGYLAQRPLDIFTMTPRYEQTEDRNVF